MSSSLERRFRFTEGRASIPAESFNILNHPNFGISVTDLAGPQFGRSTQTLTNSLGSGGGNLDFNRCTRIGGPRSIQFTEAPVVRLLSRQPRNGGGCC